MRGSSKSFTLIEILVVVAIIGILSTFVFVNVTNAKARANYNKIVVDIETIKSAAGLYYSANSSWPYDALPGETEPRESGIPKGLHNYLLDMPVTPCVANGWIYDWDNWKDLPDLNSDGSINGSKSSYDTIRVTVRDNDTIPTETIRTSKYYSCVTSDSLDHCAESDRLWAGGGIDIATVPSKAVRCNN